MTEKHTPMAFANNEAVQSFRNHITNQRNSVGVVLGGLKGSRNAFHNLRGHNDNKNGMITAPNMPLNVTSPHYVSRGTFKNKGHGKSIFSNQVATAQGTP